MRLPEETEKKIYSYISGERESHWVHEFLEKGVLAENNKLYENNYYRILMNDIIRYLGLYYSDFLEKRRKVWKKYLNTLQKRERKNGKNKTNNR